MENDQRATGGAAGSGSAIVATYIQAPSVPDWDSLDEYYSIFLAGGITGCPDWQREMVGRLSDTDLVLVNPRRDDFPVGDPGAAFKQITWEHIRLREVSAILFWFPKETLCPIVLYELGAWSMTDKPLFVGVHPEYKRRQDVEIQTGLVRPEVKIVYSLGELADQVHVDWAWGDEIDEDCK